MVLLGILPCMCYSVDSPPDPGDLQAEEDCGTPSVADKIIWYLPNRIMDLFDCFRVRGRIGPGLSAGARITDYAAFYAGSYDSIYAGLPGPRRHRLVRSPVGRENLKGVVIAGVDATDDTSCGPDYGQSEIAAGAHLLIVGAEAGIDPAEICDFISGFFFLDLGRDDFPAKKRKRKSSSAVSDQTWYGKDHISPKPPSFPSMARRMDYLHSNVQNRVSQPVRRADELAAKDLGDCIAGPDTRLRLGTYFVASHNGSTDIQFKPEVDLEIAMPNIEKRLRMFLQDSTANELPGRLRSETEGKPMTLGLRRFMKECSVSSDLGVRLKIEPEAYARLSWQPRWMLNHWIVMPQQRIFFETDDRWGALSGLRLYRWCDAKKSICIGSISSVKWTEREDAFEWEQTLKFGKIREIILRCDQLSGYSRQDVANGGDLGLSVFGRDDQIEAYRLSLGLRKPVYKKWIFLEVEPALEWNREHDFGTGYRLTIGLDMLFWGPDYE